MLLILTGTIPIGAPSSRDAKPGLAPYARAAILADVFHHVTTGFGAWQHYKMPTHYNTSMSVGVWGCAGLAVLGLVTAAWGMPSSSSTSANAKKVR